MRVALRAITNCVLGCLIAVSLIALPANAQFGGGGGGFGGGGGGFGGGGQGGGGFGGGGQGGGGFGGGGGGTQGTGPFSGVVVDAAGVMKKVSVPDPSGDLLKRRINEAMSKLDGDLTKPSKLRKVSLTRLERAVAEKVAAGEPIDEVMKNTAGLTRIDYVFCYPESGDIVVAGPAEPWVETAPGRMLGAKTGQPVIELQDLVTALRAFPPKDETNGGANSPVIFCSIDPTQEGLANFQKFISGYARVSTGAKPTTQQIRQFVSQMQQALGLQKISVGGVPLTTHFAQVLVEADYRMKLIGIGIEKPSVRLKSYVDRANPAAISRNALTRWYFVPDYERVKVSEDSLAMELVGEGVKLIGEEELVQAGGARQGVKRSNGASKGFVTAFTKMYPKMAQKTPVFAQLRNCIDLAVAAAFIQNHDLYSKANWRMTTFSDEKQYQVETLNAPKQVASAVTARWKGSTLVTPIGGGVQIRPTESLSPSNLIQDDSGEVSEAREGLSLEGLKPGQWWWD